MKGLYTLVILLLISFIFGCTSNVPTNKELAQYAKDIRSGNLQGVENYNNHFRKEGISEISLLGVTYIPLEIAAISNHLEIVEYFLKQGADPNVLSPQYNAPLIFSVVENSSHEIVKSFIKYNVNVDVMDSQGRVLMDYAASKGRTELISALIPNVKNINMVDTVGSNALFGAVYGGNVEIVEILFKHGININQKTRNGITPLMSAIGYEYTAIAEKLVELGSDLTVKNNAGHTASQVAQLNNVRVKGLWPK